MIATADAGLWRPPERKFWAPSSKLWAPPEKRIRRPRLTAGPTRVNSGFALTSTSNPSTIAPGWAQNAKDVMVVFIGWYDSASTWTSPAAPFSSIGDTAGNQYTQVATFGSNAFAATGSSAIVIYAFVCSSIKAQAANANTITVHWANGTNPVGSDIYVAEYSGNDTINAVDSATIATNAGATTSSNPTMVTQNVTTSRANELMLCYAFVGNAVGSPGTGWTFDPNSPTSDDALETRAFASAGSSITPSMVLSGNGNWAIMSFSIQPPGPPAAKSPYDPLFFSQM